MKISTLKNTSESPDKSQWLFFWIRVIGKQNTFMEYCFVFVQIMKLEIDEIAAPRSFIFLWCGSGEGLDLGRVVRWFFKIGFLNS